jgi:hypothetical protein
MGSFDVAFPAGKKIVFAPICVVCQKPNPDSTLKLSFLSANAGSESLGEMAIDEALGFDPSYYSTGNSLKKVNGIPACHSCVSGLRWYHRILKFAMYTAWIPGVVLIFLQKTPVWFDVIFLLACVVTPPIISMLYPPAFGATFSGGVANFEFKSENVARQFMTINNIKPVEEDAKKAAA